MNRTTKASDPFAEDELKSAEGKLERICYRKKVDKYQERIKKYQRRVRKLEEEGRPTSQRSIFGRVSRWVVARHRERKSRAVVWTCYVLSFVLHACLSALGTYYAVAGGGTCQASLVAYLAVAGYTNVALVAAKAHSRRKSRGAMPFLVGLQATVNLGIVVYGLVSLVPMIPGTACSEVFWIAVAYLTLTSLMYAILGALLALLLVVASLCIFSLILFRIAELFCLT